MTTVYGKKILFWWGVWGTLDVASITEWMWANLNHRQIVPMIISYAGILFFSHRLLRVRRNIRDRARNSIDQLEFWVKVFDESYALGIINDVNFDQPRFQTAKRWLGNPGLMGLVAFVIVVACFSFVIVHNDLQVADQPKVQNSWSAWNNQDHSLVNIQYVRHTFPDPSYGLSQNTQGFQYLTWYDQHGRLLEQFKVKYCKSSNNSDTTCEMVSGQEVVLPGDALWTLSDTRSPIYKN